MIYQYIYPIHIPEGCIFEDNSSNHFIVKRSFYAYYIDENMLYYDCAGSNVVLKDIKRSLNKSTLPVILDLGRDRIAPTIIRSQESTVGREY